MNKINILADLPAGIPAEGMAGRDSDAFFANFEERTIAEKAIGIEALRYE